MKDIKKLIEQGFELHRQGKVHRALEFYLKAISNNSKNPNLFFLIGTAYLQIKDFENSVIYLNKCIVLDPKNIGAQNNLGGAYQNLKKYSKSIEVFKKLLTINPKFTEAYNNIGNCYFQLNKHQDAIENFKKSIEIDPKNFVAYSNIANVYRELKLFEKSILNYKKSIELNNKYFLAFNNLANVYKDISKFDEAIINYRKAIKINDKYVSAYENLGNVFHETAKFNEAANNYKKAYDINQDHHYVLGRLIHNKMYICEWAEVESYRKILISKLKDNKKVSTPFELLSIIDDPEIHLLASKMYFDEKYLTNNFEISKMKKNKSDKIKIGYFSPDFRNHPVLHLIKDVFKHHDKSKFEVYAFSFEKHKNDEFTAEIKDFFNKFIEIKDLSDKEVYELTREIDIDIAIDLCGYTAFNRVKLFSNRVAPIQINYLGYPGSIGTNFMDYIIADQIVIPKDEIKNYSEKVVYLPNCYQPNSNYEKLKIKDLRKKDFSLPEDKVIFCNFGSNFKINAKTFDSWMNILEKVPNGILWLLKSNDESVENLKSEAQKRNIKKERIIFASKISQKEHLERLTLADIYLDTFPYSSHTTASDAIRMGIPIITLIGRSFPSRVCASILEQVNLSKLVAKTNEEFEEKATYFGNNRNKLLELKEELVNSCQTSSLFKIENFTKQLETIYINLVKKN